MRIFNRLWCGLFVGHAYFWVCEEDYGEAQGWNLIARGVCIHCGYKTQKKKVVGRK